MNQALSFQQVVMRLNEYWAEQGCVIWQPHNVQVGAGTMNPATFLRVLGPEPWNVAYVEPSARPADGRYGTNPNRWYEYYQYQVILKPDPGNHMELYLQSLEALGIDTSKHDIRWVEDNWQSPPLGAWGLGWEVWLDGLEITQYTYFQQAGGVDLNPVCVEITYGIERIVMFLQSVQGIPEICWLEGLSYGDLHLIDEIDYCKYNFDSANVDRLTQMYNLFEEEARHALAFGLVLPAHDYVLKCSHVFNILDARGAVGITQRQAYFARMRELAQLVAEAYLKQRESLGYPFCQRRTTGILRIFPQRRAEPARSMEKTADFVLEIGTEELPSSDLTSALEQLEQLVPKALDEARLAYKGIRVSGTPRRLIIYIEQLPPRQRDEKRVVRGPATNVAFDDKGEPTLAARGFARSIGLPLEELEVRDFRGRQYLYAVLTEEGQPATRVLSELLPKIIAGLRFQLSMRWNETGVTFSRPIRWLLALFGDKLVDVEYADVLSDRVTYGLRSLGSPKILIPGAEDYFEVMRANHIVVSPNERSTLIQKQITQLAIEVGGLASDDPELLEEVTNLVEQPVALRGDFDLAYLELPKMVLITVMKKHQRYFPIIDERGDLFPFFIVVANGGALDWELVRNGNAEVLRARFTDAEFFYRADTKKRLEEFLPRLDTLVFQEQLGSVLDKTRRLEQLACYVSASLGLSAAETAVANRAAHLCKADLATHMVVEFTNLQGVMGQEYALQSGELLEVAQAVSEHYLPRFADDALPESKPGIVVGLADRLDNLMGLFAVGLAPSGSNDSYHLRRDALGVVQSLIAHRITFSVRKGLEAAAALMPIDVSKEALAAALEFVIGRLRVCLREHYDYDVVEAVIAERGDDPYRAQVAAEQLSHWVKRGDWSYILENYARCVRITREFEQQFVLDPVRFVQLAEEELYTVYQEAQGRITPESSVDEFLTAFLPLIGMIDQYFARESEVLVMVEDQKLRENRLAQLQHIAALAHGIVDFGQLESF